MKFILEYEKFLNKSNISDESFVKDIVNKSQDGTFKWLVNGRKFPIDLKQNYAPKEVSKKIGFNIHTDWKIPFDINRDKIGNFLRYHTIADNNTQHDVDKTLEILYDELIRLNNRLKDIKFNKAYTELENKFHILYGAQSTFNFDDIEYWISSAPNRIHNKNEYYDTLLDNIESKIKLYWRPSITTLEIIKEYLIRTGDI